MPYTKLSDVPQALITAGLTLDQANIWARYYDEARDAGAKNPGAVAWIRFKTKYKKVDNKWVQKKESERFLIGFTIADQIPGKIKEDVTTMRQARKYDAMDIWKIDWKKGVFKQRRTRGGTRRANLYSTGKLNEPLEWLEFQGVIPAGHPGATREHVGVMTIIDKGIVEYGSSKPYMHEYFCSEGKLKGRLVFRLLPRSRGVEVEKLLDDPVGLEEYLKKNGEVIDKELEQIEKDEILPEGKVIPAREKTFYIVMQPLDQTPYVLSDNAVEKKFIPPLGFSCLPEKVRKTIPKEYQYWKARTREEAIKMRDALVEARKKIGKGKFVYQLQTYRGPIHIRFGPTTKIFHLSCDTGGDEVIHFELRGDILVNDSTSGVFVPTSDRSILTLGARGRESLKPGSKWNETKETPSFIEVLDRGDCMVYEDSREFKKIEFFGDKLKGLFIFKKEEPEMNIWLVERSSTPVSKGFERYVPIVKYNKKKGIVYGIVLKPNEVDSQGDYETEEDIEEAAHNFLIESRQIDINHWYISPDCVPVESYIAPVDFEWHGKKIKKGSWILGTYIRSPEIRKKIENGELTGYSIRGIGLRSPA